MRFNLKSEDLLPLPYGASESEIAEAVYQAILNDILPKFFKERRIKCFRLLDTSKNTMTDFMRFIELREVNDVNREGNLIKREKVIFSFVEMMDSRKKPTNAEFILTVSASDIPNTRVIFTS